MASTVFQQPARKSLTLNVTWVLTFVLFVITVENIWLDSWLKARFPAFPSLAPEPPSVFWILTFAVIGIVCSVLIVGQVLLMRRAGVSRAAKVVAGMFVLAALLLSVTWFRVTSGLAAVPHAMLLQKSHPVKLTWHASTTPGVTYNIYRVNNRTGVTDQVNHTPIPGLSYTDDTAVNGENYTYYATAVAGTSESARSNPAPANIPPS
jgi:hypothetical protein